MDNLGTVSIHTPAPEITLNQFIHTFFGMSPEDLVRDVKINAAGKYDAWYGKGEGGMRT